MPIVVGIKFRKSPRVYSFAAGEAEYTEGMGVIVETARGLEYGVVAQLPYDAAEKDIVPPLKPIVRIATPADEQTAAELDAKRAETLKICTEKVEKSGLEMKLVDAEYTFDRSKLIVYFTANGRVDFRDLVRELASVFRIRIELRQIGERDECKMLGGLGSCGRVCCCNNHLADYAQVSIKMAKNQNLSLNPTKISGLCGRLMCCLSYENAHYAEVGRRMPKMNSQVFTSDKRHGMVVGLNYLKESVRVRVEEGEKSEYADYPLSEITRQPGAPQPSKGEKSVQQVQERQPNDDKRVRQVQEQEPNDGAEDEIFEE